MTAWLSDAIERLAANPVCGYAVDGPPGAEPTALAAMALAVQGRRDAAGAALRWLAQRQAAAGGVAVDAAHAAPQWPTGWAVLAWLRAASPTPGVFEASIQRGVAWLLATKGVRGVNDGVMGHDMTVQAWPWVEGTSSWVEPTATALLALKAAGRGDDARYREGVRLLLDRVLPTGGWNCGNKIVLGTVLRPQLQPSGMALAALAALAAQGSSAPPPLLADQSSGQASGRDASAPSLEPSLDYVEQSLRGPTTPASTCFALIGLAAHGRRPTDADARLAEAYRAVCRRGGSPYHLALLVHAALGRQCPWFASLPNPAAERGDSRV
jgi:hypothetical protein